MYWDVSLLEQIKDVLYDIRSELRQIKEELKKGSNNDESRYIQHK